MINKESGKTTQKFFVICMIRKSPKMKSPTPFLTRPRSPLNKPSDICMPIQASKETPLDRVLPYLDTQLFSVIQDELIVRLGGEGSV